MKIHVTSDLHLEFFDWVPPETDADAVVLAGDIDIGLKGFAWARRSFGERPIFYVAGNHEFFGHSVPDLLEEFRRAAREYGIHFLEEDCVILDGVRVLGTTLWTDFEFFGAESARIEQAMAAAQRGMYDYHVIRVGPEQKLEPQHTRMYHRHEAAWLARELAAPFAGATVVITHHLPHARSVHPKFKNDPLNPAFVTDLSHLVRDPVNLWIHGHTHESIDFRVGSTRVLCNPRGYLPKQPNPAFVPDLVVEVGSPGGS